MEFLLIEVLHRSVEICQQYAPHWEIRNSKVLEFDAIQVDHEVMDIEKKLQVGK